MFKNFIYILFIVTNLNIQAQLNNGQKKNPDDEFNNPGSLSDWKFFNQKNDLPNKIKDYSFNKKNGCLYIEPYTACWYSGYYGIFLYKEIENDFVVTTRLKVEGKAGKLPNDKWSIAGLLIRQPMDTSIKLSNRKENWVYINSGRGKNPEWVLDSKYTVNNESVWDAIRGDSSWVELRIVRLGNLFVTMYKFDNASWKIHKQFILENFPVKMQAGINISANAAFAFDKSFIDFNTQVFEDVIPDMNVYIDYIRFNKPDISNDLRDIINTNELKVIPDEILLKNFSF